MRVLLFLLRLFRLGTPICLLSSCLHTGSRRYLWATILEKGFAATVVGFSNNIFQWGISEV